MAATGRKTISVVKWVLSLLFAEGLSTRDFRCALNCFRTDAGLSRFSFSRTDTALHEAFGEVRRRMDLVGRFPGEMVALVLIWAALEEDRLVWRVIQMEGDLRLRIVEASRTADESIDVIVA